MKRYPLMTIAATTLVMACSSPKSSPRNNEITKVGLATGGCYGQCPFLSVEVDSSLSYKFYGGEYAKKEGYYQGQVSQAFWDSLNVLFEWADHRSFQEPNWIVDDAMVFEFVIHHCDTVRHFRLPAVDVFALPGEELTRDDIRIQRMQHVLRWLMHSYTDLQLEPVKDTLQFETTTQYPLHVLIESTQDPSMEE